MTDFPASEFDDWAESYDCSISIDQFPFYGYRDMMTEIVAQANPRPGMLVLDLGTGTGNLAFHFARAGCEVWCTDFSEPMLDKARQKIPAAHFGLHDLRTPLPLEFQRPFDRIVSAYVFHHFELDEKVRILRGLLAYLAPGGQLLLGDIAFPDQSALEQVKTEVGDDWDDEYYWLADESLSALEQARMKVCYQQISVCAGIFVIQNEG